jgi:KAP family P-loop domain
MVAEPATTVGSGTTLLGLVSAHGHQAGPGVMDLMHLGAAAQRERHDAGHDDSDALTRSTALWAAVQLDADVAHALERHGATREQLGGVLSLRKPPRPMAVEDVAVQEALARALDTAFARAPTARTLTVRDIVVAILRDVVADGGVLGSRLAGLKVDPAALLADLAPPEPAVKGPPAAAMKAEPRPVPAALSNATVLYLGFYEALRSDEPDADDSRALWAAFGLVATRRRDTLAAVVTRTVLSLRGQPVRRWYATAGLRAFDLRVGMEPVPLESIDLEDHPVVVRAGQVRDRLQPDDAIHLRHVVAVALEDGSGPRGPDTRDADVEAVRMAVLDQLAVDAPADVVERWRAYFAEPAGTEPEPTGEPPGPGGRPVAGVDVDMVDDGTRLSDELHTVGDVVTLCDMLAAKDAVPPISVGLFGRWGSGKSYFMALMRRRIDELQQAAVEARDHDRQTSYCSQIVQVTFNAWHYMDADDLWATLAVHLFGAIAQIDPDDDRARPRAEVVRELEAREQAMQPVDQKITRALDDDRVARAADTMGLDAERQDVLGMIGAAGTTFGYLSAAKALLTAPGWSRRRKWLVAGLGAALVLVVVLAALLVTGVLPIGWLIAWVPLAGTALGTVTRWLRRIRDGLDQVSRVAAELGLEPSDVTAERIENDARVRELRAELTRIDQLTGLRDWLEERALSTDYTSHFGVISVLRGDLEALVEKQRRDAPDRRIILYIDDLDRCPPARVVEVLQAVHLLLAFPLFVAVVGVDPRWLLRSLEHHYREVLSTPDGAGQRPVDDVVTETTPHDYLEKIFQIPFWVRAMDRDSSQKFVAGLIGPKKSGRSGQQAGTSRQAGARLQTGAAQEPGSAEQAGTAQQVGVDPQLGSDEPLPGQPSPTDQRSGVDQQPGGTRAATSGQPQIGTGQQANTGGQQGTTGTLIQVDTLGFTPSEVKTLVSFAEFVGGSPRRAKRFVNLCQLLKTSLRDMPSVSSDPLVDERALIVALAVVTGAPHSASAFFRALAPQSTAQPDGTTTATYPDLSQVKERLPRPDAGTRELNMQDVVVRLIRDNEKDQVSNGPDMTRALYQLANTVRRYSFETAN